MAGGENDQLSNIVQQFEPHVQRCIPKLRAAELDGCSVLYSEDRARQASVCPFPQAYVDRKDESSQSASTADWVTAAFQCVFNFKITGNIVDVDWYTLWDEAVIVVDTSVGEG